MQKHHILSCPIILPYVLPQKEFFTCVFYLLPLTPKKSTNPICLSCSVKDKLCQPWTASTETPKRSHTLGHFTCLAAGFSETPSPHIYPALNNHIELQIMLTPLLLHLGKKVWKPQSYVSLRPLSSSSGKVRK